MNSEPLSTESARTPNGIRAARASRIAIAERALALVRSSSTSQRDTTSRAVNCLRTRPGSGRTSSVSTWTRSPGRTATRPAGLRTACGRRQARFRALIRRPRGSRSSPVRRRRSRIRPIIETEPGPITGRMRPYTCGRCRTCPSVPTSARRPPSIRGTRAPPTSAAGLARLIASARPGTHVEHIGSSAVPGLPGKNVVDLGIEADPDEIPPLTDALRSLGFGPQGGLAPFPPARPMLTGNVVHDGTSFRVHCHVIPPARGELRELVAFRDALRADPALRDAYAAEKRRIVDAAPDGEANQLYTVRKSDFVQDSLYRLGIRHGPGRRARAAAARGDGGRHGRRAAGADAGARGARDGLPDRRPGPRSRLPGRRRRRRGHRGAVRRRGRRPAPGRGERRRDLRAGARRARGGRRRR